MTFLLGSVALPVCPTRRSGAAQTGPLNPPHVTEATTTTLLLQVEERENYSNSLGKDLVTSSCSLMEERKDIVFVCEGCFKGLGSGDYVYFIGMDGHQLVYFKRESVLVCKIIIIMNFVSPGCIDNMDNKKVIWLLKNNCITVKIIVYLFYFNYLR